MPEKIFTKEQYEIQEAIHKAFVKDIESLTDEKSRYGNLKGMTDSEKDAYIKENFPITLRYFGDKLKDAYSLGNSELEAIKNFDEKIMEFDKIAQEQEKALDQAKEALAEKEPDKIKHERSSEKFALIKQAKDRFDKWSEKHFGAYAYDSHALKLKEKDKRANLKMIDRNCKKIKKMEMKFNKIYQKEVNKQQYKIQFLNKVSTALGLKHSIDVKDVKIEIPEDKLNKMNDLQKQIADLNEKNIDLYEENKTLSQEQIDLQSKNNFALKDWDEYYARMDIQDMELKLAKQQEQLSIIAEEKGFDINEYKENYNPAQIYQIVRAVKDYDLSKEDVDKFISPDIPADKMAVAFSMAFQERSFEALDKYFPGETPEEVKETIINASPEEIEEAFAQEKEDIKNGTIEEVLGEDLAQQVIESQKIQETLEEGVDLPTEKELLDKEPLTKPEVGEIIPEMEEDKIVVSFVFDRDKAGLQQFVDVTNTLGEIAENDKKLDAVIKNSLEIYGMEEFMENNQKFPGLCINVPMEMKEEFLDFMAKNIAEKEAERQGKTKTPTEKKNETKKLDDGLER